MEQLRTPVRVLYVAAHPDDENTQMLTWLARGRSVRAAYLSLTRGDGGQNLIGAEQRPLLGVIRTHELLAARNIDGAEQWFSRLRDFGYSKSAPEALSKWGEEEALEEVVRVFRTFRPHVVITRFPEEGRTHGHHLASARLARSAMHAAGDAERFPDQVKAGLRPWQVRRLFYNFPHFWASRGGKPPPGARFDVDVGGFAAGLGRSYGELSAFSRSMHKSQGFGASARTGPWTETLVLLEGDEPKTDVLEGLPTWADIPGGGEVSSAIEDAFENFDARRPASAIPWLGRAHAAAAKIEDPVLASEVRARLEQLLVDASGLLVEARAEVAEVEAGGSLEVELKALARGEGPIVIRRVSGLGVDITPRVVLDKHAPWSKKIDIVAPAGEPTRPHWLEGQPGDFRYTVDAERGIHPMESTPVRLVFELGVGGVGLSYEVEVRRHWVDPVLGERTQPVEVAPPVAVTPAVSVLLVPEGQTQSLAFEVRAGPEGWSGRLSFEGGEVTPPTFDLELAAEELRRVEVGVKADKRGALRVLTSRAKAQIPAWSRRVVDHPHLPVVTHRAPAEVELVPVALTLPKGAVGYVPGSGDAVAEILGRAGLEVVSLDGTALTSGDLSRFRSIVVGIRAFNVNKDLVRARERLMGWVADGGTLVVQYNTKNWSSKLNIDIGPKPITINRGRVTDETAKVERLQKNHPLLTRPHRITDADFEGWVQERGLYFAETWDPAYTPLFSMHDPGEEPLKGSTLYMAHGNGHFVFSGLSFFRQLPAGVPGALRLLVNFISAGQEDDA
ncbi:MAG: PIG-L family deacetylase, partial [Myxococcota bacterium]